jgi:hypothetical protein
MKNYEATKNKIGTLWEACQKNDIDIDKITNLNIKIKSINYKEYTEAYLIEENITITMAVPYYGIFKLENWEESNSSELQLIVVFNPTKESYGILPVINAINTFVRKVNDEFYVFVYVSVFSFAGGDLSGNFYLKINNWRKYNEISTK